MSVDPEWLSVAHGEEVLERSQHNAEEVGSAITPQIVQQAITELMHEDPDIGVIDDLELAGC